MTEVLVITSSNISIFNQSTPLNQYTTLILNIHIFLHISLFVDSIKPSTASDLWDLFKVTHSIHGGNRRCLENDTILVMVLEFATGATVLPPLGFEDTPIIEFLHTYPESNTCAVTLRLPLHSTYNAFREFMTSGIVKSPHFGVA
uniref:HECT domain-containing protein n=1 Tax=Oncorhynchus tshawytscha TaxID=74940 RepID=A0A8C8ELS6_ONCTS